jgi:hypothetical protein
MYVCRCVCIYICVQTCEYMHMHIYIYIPIYTYIYIYVVFSCSLWFPNMVAQPMVINHHMCLLFLACWLAGWLACLLAGWLCCTSIQRHPPEPHIRAAQNYKHQQTTMHQPRATHCGGKQQNDKTTIRDRASSKHNKRITHRPTALPHTHTNTSTFKHIRNQMCMNMFTCHVDWKPCYYIQRIEVKAIR